MNQLSVVLPLVIVVSTLGALGQTLLKYAINGAQRAGADGLGSILTLLRTGTFWGGGLLVTAGTLTWLYVMSRAHLTYAMPFLGLGMVFTMVTSAVILHEPMVPMRIVGTLVVAVGLALVAKS